jgi:2-methylisocitrate lyase-like PEP mutase family enzyme
MAKKEDIDEKLIKWNEIFNELTLDAEDLIKDIKDMINYVAFSAMLMVMMGVAAVLIAVLRNLGPKYIAMSVIIFSIMAGNAYQLINKWLRLRIRYDKLSSIQNKIDSS